MFKEKDFDLDRIAEECNFETDPIDKRILYEMTGERLSPTDFIDDTTDSEESSRNSDDDDLGGENESYAQVSPLLQPARINWLFQTTSHINKFLASI